MNHAHTFALMAMRNAKALLERVGWSPNQPVVVVCRDAFVSVSLAAFDARLVRVPQGASVALVANGSDNVLVFGLANGELVAADPVEFERDFVRPEHVAVKREPRGCTFDVYRGPEIQARAVADTAVHNVFSQMR